MNTTNIGKFDIKFINKKELNILRNEIFVNEIYSFKSNSHRPIIIDAGAYIGLATIYFKSLYLSAKIYALEPNWQSFELLQRNIMSNSLTDCEIFNLGLSKSGGVKTFYIDGTTEGWDSTASLYKGTWQGTKLSSEIKVQTKKLSEFLAGLPETKIDLLKLDIEGSEQSVLKEAINELAKVDQIFTEFHPVKGNDIKKVLKILTKAGFVNEVIEDGQLMLIKSRRLDKK